MTSSFCAAIASLIFLSGLSPVSLSVSSAEMVYFQFPVAQQCLSNVAAFHRYFVAFMGVIRVASHHGDVEKSGLSHPGLVSTNFCTSLMLSSVHSPTLSLLNIPVHTSSMILICSCRMTTRSYSKKIDLPFRPCVLSMLDLSQYRAPPGFPTSGTDESLQNLLCPSL